VTAMPIINKKSWLLADKKTKLPPEQINSGEIFFCAHIGISMNPTLTKQDLLEIAPYQEKPLKVGDVVLFQTSNSYKYVIHRIVNITHDGYKTKGDNSDLNDPWTLPKKHIYGRIIAAHQGDKCRKIAGGFFGRLTCMSCLMRRKTNGIIVKLLGPIYRPFCTDGFLHWLIPVRLTPQVATFQSNTNTSHTLLLGKRIIGSYDESLLQWQIRRPYRLFVDESSLPKPR